MADNITALTIYFGITLFYAWLSFKLPDTNNKLIALLKPSFLVMSLFHLILSIGLIWIVYPDSSYQAVVPVNYTFNGTTVETLQSIYSVPYAGKLQVLNGILFYGNVILISFVILLLIFELVKESLKPLEEGANRMFNETDPEVRNKG